MSLDLSFPILIYGIMPNSETDYVEEIFISMKTTAADVVQTVLETVFGPHVEASEFALYETEFVRGFSLSFSYVINKNLTKSAKDKNNEQQEPLPAKSKREAERKLSDRKSRGIKLFRRYIRELNDEEHPLPLSVQWKLKKHAAYFSFTIKRREIDIPTQFALLRRVIFLSIDDGTT